MEEQVKLEPSLQFIHFDCAKPRLCYSFVYSYPFSKLILDVVISLSYETLIRLNIKIFQQTNFNHHFVK